MAVITGLSLVFLRPFPNEIFNIPSGLAAIEVWFMSAMTCIGWCRLRSRRSAIGEPFMVAVIAAILFMSFFYSYSYNMGLLVRARLHVFPGTIALAGFPHLLRGSKKWAVNLGAVRRRGRLLASGGVFGKQAGLPSFSCAVTSRWP